MPNHTDIYNNEADKYELLISKQSCLLDQIEAILPAEGLDILDLGAGTGRFTIPLARKAKTLLAVDASAAMLEVLSSKLLTQGSMNWTATVADHRAIPAKDHSFDLVVSGWSLSYIGNTNVPQWRSNIQQVMQEIQRVLKPGGTFIVMETLGTGTLVPRPPDFLTGYYELLEKEYGFSHRSLRTDYHFSSLNEAKDLARFFFGDELAEQVTTNHWITLPECAGIWWRSF
jgi:ubiquinone/menaquinone biosynthesis C-methylase UbiE